MKTLANVDMKDKRVLMRLDLNVPIQEGKIMSDARIQAALPTIRKALEKGAAVLIMAHLGRPVEGEYDPRLSLAAVARYLSELLALEVPLVEDYLKQVPRIQPGEVVMLENVRFNEGEKKNDATLSAQYAALCDVFVSDGFGVVHRAQASTVGVAEKAKVACAGLLLEKEVKTLEAILRKPARPMMAIVGGSKVSTKLMVLQSLLEKVDVLIPGGGIANTFLAASGCDVGASLYEPDLIEQAQAMLAEARARAVKIPLPKDVVVGDEFSENATVATKAIEEIAPNEMILDIGPQTAQTYARSIAEMKTVVWNGPLGVFEMEPFAHGTERICAAIADCPGFTFAGGGDTLAAIDRFGIAEKVNYISTGGGSMLEYLEGKKLPGLAVLEG